MTVYIINVLDNYALTGWEETLVCTEEEAIARVKELKANGLDAEVIDEYEIWNKSKDLFFLLLYRTYVQIVNNLLTVGLIELTFILTIWSIKELKK